MGTRPTIYTHAMWRVRAGAEDAFIAAWNRLAERFAELPTPPHWGTLIRSTSDPRLFYSFGPWVQQSDVDAMRADPAARQAFARLQELCEEMTPGTYELVRHVALEGGDSTSR